MAGEVSSHYPWTQQEPARDRAPPVTHWWVSVSCPAHSAVAANSDRGRRAQRRAVWRRLHGTCVDTGCSWHGRSETDSCVWRHEMNTWMSWMISGPQQVRQDVTTGTMKYIWRCPMGLHWPLLAIKRTAPPTNVEVSRESIIYTFNSFFFLMYQVNYVPISSSLPDSGKTFPRKIYF